MQQFMFKTIFNLMNYTNISIICLQKIQFICYENLKYVNNAKLIQVQCTLAELFNKFKSLFVNITLLPGYVLT